MHGNQHALMAELADTRLTLWLGLPAARAHFDPSTLSAPDQARFAEHRSARRRADFEVSRALLGFANDGKAAYSLSHSAEHAALLIAPAGWQIGVDLEMDRPRDVLRLARFAFDEREARALESTPAEARQALFYTLWTLKESFAKALRLDLVDALRQCVFLKDADRWCGDVPTRAAWSAAVFQPRRDIYLGAALISSASMHPHPAAAFSAGLPPEQSRPVDRISDIELWEWPPRRRAHWPLVVACASAPSTVDAAPA